MTLLLMVLALGWVLNGAVNALVIWAMTIGYRIDPDSFHKHPLEWKWYAPPAAALMGPAVFLLILFSPPTFTRLFYRCSRCDTVFRHAFADHSGWGEDEAVR